MNTGTDRFISLTRYTDALDYLDRSAIDQVRLIGGEPTLHPQFAELAQLALDRGKSLLIFTNGIMPQKSLEAITCVAPDRCIVLVNANTFSTHLEESAVTARRKKVIEELGSRCRLGFTIYTTNFDLEPVIRLIEETGAGCDIRLGLAQPAGDANRFLHPKQYPLIGTRIAYFAERAAELGIRIELDCGFVRCMFSNADIERLTACKVSLSWRCNPVIDLDMDGTAYHCFPLYSFGGIAGANQLDAAAVRSQLESRVAGIRGLGIYEECDGCSFRLTERCSAGCLAVKLIRASRRPWQAYLPEKTGAQVFEYKHLLSAGE